MLFLELTSCSEGKRSLVFPALVAAEARSSCWFAHCWWYVVLGLGLRPLHPSENHEPSGRLEEDVNVSHLAKSGARLIYSAAPHRRQAAVTRVTCTCQDTR